jgi:Na+/H+-translocating membrane pyrophosphatase
MMQAMKFSRSLRKLGQQIEDSVDSVGNSGTTLLRNIGWVSAGITALALGVVVGRELRQRYQFNRRTPYDFYAHSGDRAKDVEFGVGI